MRTGDVQLSVLGEVEVRYDGEPVDLGPPKQRAVLGVLLAASPREVALDDLVDEVWGADRPADPRRSLQVYVSALRRVMPGVEITGSRTGYRLEVPSGSLDAAVFEAESRDAAAAAEVGDHHRATDLAQRALTRWRGEPWRGLDHTRPTADEAARLVELRLRTEQVLARSLLALGRHAEAAGRLEPLVDAHPLDEGLRGQLMLALHGSGRRADALETYAEGRRVSIEETGLEPGADLRALQARLLADDPALSAAEAELRTRRHLPTPLTRLRGRQDEVFAVVAAFSSGDRLVTVTGPGGIGKTRVGLAAAHELAALVPDGVWFVDLSEVQEPVLVAQTVNDVLGVDEAGVSAWDALEHHVADRSLLLLLDNVEQVADAAADIGRLLTRAPGLNVLATSRVPLQVYGEAVHRLEPLPDGEAVELFEDRARAAEHRFVEERRDDVRQVCAALDHLPLAIELVAARADRMTFDEIVATLASEREGRLALAGDGPRDRSPRQRSLRDAIAWSVQLLEPATAHVFTRLSVFAGGFDADAATRVAGATPEQLAELDRASLLRPVGYDRFALLQTVREWAREELSDTDAVRDRHAQFFAELAVASVGGMRGPAMPDWLRRLRAERANMRSALGWLAERVRDGVPDAARTLLEATAGLGLYWYRDAPGSEDVEWLPLALELAVDASADLRGRALYALAICRAEQGRIAEALAHGRECHELLRSSPDPRWRARALNTLAGITRDAGDAAAAVPMMDEAIALRRELADPTLPLAMSLANRAMAALDLHDVDGARRCLEECLAIAEHDELERALAHVGLAEVALAEGDPDEARTQLTLGIPVLRRLGLDYRLVETLDLLAGLAVQEGRAYDAAVLVAAADRAMAEEGSEQVPADAAMRARRIGTALEQLGAERCDRAAATAARLTLEEAVDFGMDGRPGDVAG